MTIDPASLSADSPPAANPRRRTMLAVSGACLVGLSKLAAFYLLRGVAGMLAALGKGAAQDVAQMDAYFHRVTVNLWIWTLPGLIGLVILGCALTHRQKIGGWLLITIVGVVVLGAPFYQLRKFRKFIESDGTSESPV